MMFTRVEVSKRRNEIYVKPGPQLFWQALPENVWGHFHQRHPSDRHKTSVRHESDIDTRLLLSQDTYLLFVIVPIFLQKKEGKRGDAFFGFMSKSKVPTTVELRRRGGIWYSLSATRRVSLLVAGVYGWFANGSKVMLLWLLILEAPKSRILHAMIWSKYRNRTKLMLQVWWILILLLLKTSASTCRQHSHSL